MVGNFSFFIFLCFCFTQIKESGTYSIYSVFLPEKIQRSAIVRFFSSLTVALILSLCAIALPSLAIAYPFSLLFYDFTGQTGAVIYFGYVLPSFLLFMISAVLLGIKPLKTLDLVVPAYPLTLIFAKLACFCEGCCNGIQTNYGFYNYFTKVREFPVQLVESAEALVIFFILLKLRKKAKLGTMFPLYLIFYSTMRFFSEFLRVEPDIFGPLKCAQIFCVAGIVLGFLGFVLAEKYAERIDEFFCRTYSKIERKLCEKFSKKSA